MGLSHYPMLRGCQRTRAEMGFAVGGGKSFDFRVLAGCEGETPSPQLAGDTGATFIICNFILL
jgi:hypothetical protein